MPLSSSLQNFYWKINSQPYKFSFVGNFLFLLLINDSLFIFTFDILVFYLLCCGSPWISLSPFFFFFELSMLRGLRFFFPRLGKFSVIISSNKFAIHLFCSCNVFVCSILSKRSLNLASFFNPFFFLLFLLCASHYPVFQIVDIILYPLVCYWFPLLFFFSF